MRIFFLAICMASLSSTASAQSIFDRMFGDDADDYVEYDPRNLDEAQPPVAPDVERAPKTETLPEHEGDVSPLAGSWTISTERNSTRCTLGGTAHITTLPSGTYTCELVMEDYCRDGLHGIIRQSCELSLEYDQVIVAAEVLEALYGPISGYAPDHFILAPASDGTYVGHHEGRYPATWRRVIDGIS